MDSNGDRFRGPALDVYQGNGPGSRGSPLVDDDLLGSRNSEPVSIAGNPSAPVCNDQGSPVVGLAAFEWDLLNRKLAKFLVSRNVDFTYGVQIRHGHEEKFSVLR